MRLKTANRNCGRLRDDGASVALPSKRRRKITRDENWGGETRARSDSHDSDGPHPNCPVPLQFRAIGTSALALVSLPAPGSGRKASSQEALDWLAEALPIALNDPDTDVGLSAFTAGKAIGTAAVVVPEVALQHLEPPPGSEIDQPWVALRATTAHLGPEQSPPSASMLAAIGSELSAAGLRWSTLLGSEAEAILLLREEDVPAATIALVRGGHAVGPPDLVCHQIPPEDPDAAKKNSEFVGVWCLSRREQPAQVVAEQYTKNSGPLRIQSPSGVYVEVRIPTAANGRSKAQKSCAGYHVVVDIPGGRQMSLRHKTVDFKPPMGGIICTQTRFDHNVMGELSYPKSRFREEYIEAWTRLYESPVTALELISESPRSRSKTGPRTGYWIFCGKRWARVVGLPRGEGIVAGSCCSSLAQLESIDEAGQIQKELHTMYEACWGKITGPGRFRISQDAWSPQLAGQYFFNASADIGGSVLLGKTEVTHRMANGVEQVWRVRDWGFNPFVPHASPGSNPALSGAAEAAAAALASSSYSTSISSESESSDRRRRKSRRHASRGRRRRRRSEKSKTETANAHHANPFTIAGQMHPGQGPATMHVVHPSMHSATAVPTGSSVVPALSMPQPVIYGPPPGAFGHPPMAPGYGPPPAMGYGPPPLAGPLPYGHPLGAHAPPPMASSPPQPRDSPTSTKKKKSDSGVVSKSAKAAAAAKAAQELANSAVVTPNSPEQDVVDSPNHASRESSPEYPDYDPSSEPETDKQDATDKPDETPIEGSSSQPSTAENEEQLAKKLRAGAQKLRQRLKIKGGISGLRAQSGASVAKGPPAVGNPPRSLHGMSPYGPPMPHMMYPPPPMSSYGPLLHYGALPQSQTPPSAGAPKRGKRKRGKDDKSPKRNNAPSKAKVSGAVAKSATAAAKKASGAVAKSGVKSPAKASAKSSGAPQVVVPRMVNLAEKRKLLDDEVDGPPKPCRFIVVVWPDRRLAYHMVRTRQIALIHFKEDFTSKVNMQSGYRLMMLVPPDEKKEKPDVYGYIIFRLEEASVSVVQIAIPDEHRGKGFGRQALDWLIGYAENARCESVFLGSPLESVEFYEECGFQRATSSSAVLGGKDLRAGVLPMEYRRGTRKSANVQRRQMSREELVNGVFDILDGDCNGQLSKAELRRYAGWSGFGGTDDQWNVEYSRICKECSADSDAGLDRMLFAKLINDRSEVGLFIDNDGLRDMLTQLSVQTPAHLKKKKVATTVSQASRKDFVKAIFKMCDTDCDGFLDMQEMKTFAAHTGAGEINGEQWKDEFHILCSEHGADPAKGISVQLLEKLVSDPGERGCYCDDDELRAIKGAFELVEKEKARKAAMQAPERIALVKEVFRVLDVDKDGQLNEREMRGFAEHLGFRGDDEKWSEEYRSTCSSVNGSQSVTGPDVNRLLVLVNDLSEGGWYCSDEELRRIAEEGPKVSSHATSTHGGSPKPTSPVPVSTASPRAAEGSPLVGTELPETKPKGVRQTAVCEIFDALLALSNSASAGGLGESEMFRFAVVTGFDGTRAEWAEEFQLICADHGGGSMLSVDQFSNLVNEGDGHVALDELQSILSDLQQELEEMKRDTAPG